MTGEEIWACKPEFSGDAGKDGAGYSSIVISDAVGIKQYVQFCGKGLIGIGVGWLATLDIQSSGQNPLRIFRHPSSEISVRINKLQNRRSALLELKSDGDGVAAEEKMLSGLHDFQQSSRRHGSP